MSISSQIEFFKRELPPKVKLVAVSKFKTVEDIKEAYAAGQRCFGENRPQEMAAKAPLLPKDIEWHFIGHLQSNKIKLVLPYSSLIHSVDTEKLLYEINRQAVILKKNVNCLIELHIAEEETKYGFSAEDALSLASRLGEYPNVRVKGVMAMATQTDSAEVVHAEFARAAEIHREFAQIASASFPSIYRSVSDIPEISMGMTHDYKIGIAEGSTIVRIGSAIFGSRN